jgi:hypothetical protein
MRPVVRGVPKASWPLVPAQSSYVCHYPSGAERLKKV